MRILISGCQAGLFLVVLILLMPANLVVADDFLSEIEAESGKVDSRQVEDEANGVAESTADAEETGAREEFEAILAERYHGSYTFYTKLPERSQQEIVQEYQRGTSFVVLRKKIVDRFMQR